MDTIDWGQGALPQAPPGTRPPATCARTASRPPRRTGAYPVLVVDDDDAIRETLGMVLDDAGFTTCATGTGDEAIARLSATPTPLVVLVDLIMPQPDGRGVLRVVAANPSLARRHAFIIVTAAADALVHEAQEEIGHFEADLMLDTVRKPFDIDDVIAAVERSQRRLRSAHGVTADVHD